MDKQSPESENKPLKTTKEQNGELVVETDNVQRDLYANDENKERGNWSGNLDFLFSMLGYSVGLGNIWRFSYLCHRNGGGAFLIPYLLTLAVVGIPMFFFETSLAQFSSLGPLHCWGCAPLFKGIGVTMVLLTLVLTIYYNVLISYSLIYIVASFNSYLPWMDCNSDWNSPVFCIAIICSNNRWNSMLHRSHDGCKYSADNVVRFREKPPESVTCSYAGVHCTAAEFAGWCAHGHSICPNDTPAFRIPTARR